MKQSDLIGAPERVPEVERLQAKNRRRRRGDVLLLCLLLLAGTLIAAGIIWTRDQPARDYTMEETAKSTEELDESNAMDNLRQQLQDAADAATFTIQIYSKPQFPDGASEGPLYIANSVDNQYDLEVRIFLDDSGETVYESPRLKPGENKAQDKLSVDLDAGEYPATAMFTAYDAESGEHIGQAAAALTITVLN